MLSEVQSPPSAPPSPGRRRDGIAAVVVLLYTAAYFRTFGGMTLTEDTGYYGFLARVVGNGAVLHKDVPTTTNSLGIYLTALLFKVVGPSALAFRLFHLAGLSLLLGATYLLLSRRIGWWASIGGVLLVGVYATDPTIMLDLGRNFIFWSTALVVTGLAFAQWPSGRPGRWVASGAAFGLAALFRETFLVYGLGYALYLCGEGLLERGRPLKAKLRTPALFALGATLALSINAMLLLFAHTTGGYLHDMLGGGVGFRYQGGLLAPARLQENLTRWFVDDPLHNVRVDIPLFVMAAVALPVARGRLALTLKLALLPVALAEALVVNKSFPYHVVPVATFAAMLVAITFDGLWARGVAPVEATPSSRARFFAGVAFGALSLVLLVGLVDLTYFSYYPLARDAARAPSLRDRSKWPSSPANAYALASILDEVPHQRLVTFAQWQMLMLTKHDYPARPFIEDLSAPDNLGRPDLMQTTVDAMHDGGVDLLAFKSTSPGFPGNDPADAEEKGLGSIAGREYYFLADLPRESTLEFYSAATWDRLLIRRGLAATYPLVDTTTVTVGATPERHSVALTAPASGGPFFIVARPTVPLPDFGYALHVGRSAVTYRPPYTNENLVSSFVRAGDGYTLELAPSVTTEVPFTVETRAIR